MDTRKVFILFSDTGTVLGKAINICTNSTMNHVSIAFDPELTEVYSFGRKRPRNPFIGGFVKENVSTAFFRNTTCAVYSFTITNQEYNQMLEKIKTIEQEKDNYRYNFIGLFLVPLNKQLHRKNAFFCSQFVATLLGVCSDYQNLKPPCLTKPQDIRAWHQLQLIYRGKLIDYPGYLQAECNQTVKAEKSPA
ncbi:hypothetical protein [Sediminibacillus albus]|uniref:Permuted papain-like amidase enzyme, YaeF/YiiX, C92 family n=1 Tax=Sediminibacillus albus TaxID=407036 RepID=A0A1G8ZS99_9BACI|nr:hypothetical protein [Sediminibacillus albus]SDK17986.1 hypothetical protein SAMN05216243_2197 [Sediminibacillus albus]